MDAPETDIETDIEPDTETPEQWTGRQLRQCRRMAELALQLAETAARQAQEQAQSGKKTKGPDPSLIFIRLCTTVRQSIALEARLTAGPKPARHRTAPPSPEPKPAIQPAPVMEEAPPATLLPVPKNTGEKRTDEKKPGQAPQAEPDPDEFVLTPVFDGKTYTPTYVPRGAALPASSPIAIPPARKPAFEPAQPAWPPPAERRITDPPLPSGPNWARLSER